MRGWEAVIRPPWTRDAELKERCTRCGICREACSPGLIELDADGLPVLNLARGGCDLCGRCAIACPEDLFDDERPAMPWVAAVDGPCLSYPAAATCEACCSVCPSGAVQLLESSGGVRFASIDPERCNGCGACLSICPTDAIGLCLPRGRDTR